MGVFAVGDGDHMVGSSPDDQHGHAFGEVQAVAGVDALALGADHGAQGCQEGGAPVTVGERRVSAGDLGDIRVRAQADGRQAPRERRSGDASRPCGRGDEQVCARERGGAQHGTDLRAEPAAADQHEALGGLGELVGELHRDAAAQRVPDERRAIVTERDEQVAQAGGERPERVVAAAGR